MNSEDDNTASAPAGGSDAELARVAAELAALGEPDLGGGDDAETGVALGVVSVTSDAAVLAAFALAYPQTATTGPIGVAQEAPLGDLDRERAWRRVLRRRSGSDQPRPSAPSWRATWVAVATAAGLALVPMLAPPPVHETPASRATAEALGVQARAALDTVPGSQDGARASELAAKYSARLSAPPPDAEGDR